MSVRQFSTSIDPVFICDAPEGSVFTIAAVVTRPNGKIGTIVQTISVLNNGRVFKSPDEGKSSGSGASFEVAGGKLMAVGMNLAWKVKYQRCI